MLNATRLASRRSSQQLQDATKARARLALVCRSDDYVDLLDLHAPANATESAPRFSYSELVGATADNESVAVLRKLLNTSASS